MIRKIKKLVIVIISLLIITSILIFVTGNEYIFKAAKLTYLQGNVTANIDDYKDFDVRIIKNGTPQLWQYHKNYNKRPLTNILKNKLQELQSAGFLIVKDGKIITEKYFNKYTDSSLTNSFSVAKTFVTMLLGKAIEEGYIKSLQQPITDFLQEYQNDSLAKTCTIGDLSAMTSGLNWNESYYLPLNETAKSYYGEHLKKQMFATNFNSVSGKKFEYKSANTILLGIIIARATKKTLSDYLSEKFWKPLGMESPSPWYLDHKNGIEKTSCCVAARLRDFAKMGQLLLQKGNWNGNQLLDSTFIKTMTHPNALNGKIKNPIYGYGVWTDYNNKPPIYAMVGHLGQRVICIPSKKMVIVRTGNISEKKNTTNKIPGTETYVWVEEALKMTEN